MDPDNPIINETGQQTESSHFKEEEEKKEEVDAIILENSEELCFSAISFVLQCINKLLQTLSGLLVIPGIYPAD